ncbi:MAG: SEC-C domain-containing protein [Polyangiales bacterium]
MSAKPGRNDLCWCGSGKKYKKCHLATDEAAALERSRAIAETRKEIAAASAPEGVKIRKVEPEAADESALIDQRFTRAWASADLDARLALLRDAIGGAEPASSEWILDAINELAPALRETQRTADLDPLLDLVRQRRADCMDIDGGYYELIGLENAHLRGEDIASRFESVAREVVLDPDGLGFIELLAFRDETALLRAVLPEVLESLQESVQSARADILDAVGDGDASDDDRSALSDADDAEASVDDVGFLLADLEIAEAIRANPGVVDDADALVASVGRYVPVDLDWFGRILRQAAGVDGPPAASALESDDDDAVSDAVVLYSHRFARWLATQVTWTVGRRVLARMCLADALMLHVASLRRPSLQALLLPANALLKYASDGEHAASSVALLTAGAWWNAWLAEQGWVGAVEVSRELRLLRRDWPSLIGTTGGPGGDPVLNEALLRFWETFPTAYLEPRGSLPPPGR